MGLKDLWQSWKKPQRTSGARERRVHLSVEELEDRCVPDATSTLSGGTLLITGLPAAFDRITVSLNSVTNQIVVQDNGVQTALFDNAAVNTISIQANAHDSIVRVDQSVLQPTLIQGGPGTNFLYGGGGPTTLIAGPGTNRLVGGSGDDVLDGTQGTDNVLSGGGGKNTLLTGAGRTMVFGAKDRDTLLATTAGNTTDLRLAQTPPDLSSTLGLPPSPVETLATSDVSQLLQRAAAATASDNAIVAVVDRQGRILGVRVEGNVLPSITQNTQNLVFSVDGAVAEARTAAFFASNSAPLTPRTIQFISQTTITQREVESNPSIADPNSPFKGPGFVAPVGIAGHFPPNIPNTPQVDLFEIEGTNRDTTVHLGASGIPGGSDSTRLQARFNIDPAFIPASIPTNEWLAPPDSYGFLSGLEPNALPRGIGTLPGGIPIYKNGVLVGGIGVFFPGNSGFATEENSSLSSTFDPSKPDLSVQAEYIAYAAVGGSAPAGFPIGTLGGIAPVQGISLPFGRIDLVGITLPLFGPGTPAAGPENLVRQGSSLGIGDPNSGFNAPLLQRDSHDLVTPGVSPLAPNNLLDGVPVPEGFLVTPHDGAGISAAQVQQIIAQGVQQAVQTRAAIRLPLDSTTRMVLAVSDNNGNVVGLFRMPDATVFSIDVAVAKSRNVAYYANPLELQPIDQVPGIPPGTAFTNRTFRYLALPHFPEGVDSAPPGPFSILNDGGTSLTTATDTGLRLPASAFQSVLGHDAFNPQTNFRDPFNINNQNGIVFFPGSSPLYVNNVLVGGFGVSGDGVDQDDVVTTSGQVGFTPPASILTADQTFFNGVRLPYQKTNRQPLEP
jgi:uncharacterized protein GlcG (DUF336 family)